MNPYFLIVNFCNIRINSLYLVGMKKLPSFVYLLLKTLFWNLLERCFFSDFWAISCIVQWRSYNLTTRKTEKTESSVRQTCRSIRLSWWIPRPHKKRREYEWRWCGSCTYANRKNYNIWWTDGNIPQKRRSVRAANWLMNDPQKERILLRIVLVFWWK